MHVKAFPFYRVIFSFVFAISLGNRALGNVEETGKGHRDLRS